MPGTATVGPSVRAGLGTRVGRYVAIPVGAVLGNRGGAAGSMCITKDITERRRTEEQLYITGHFPTIGSSPIVDLVEEPSVD